jgi:hypothetical protein
MGAHRDPLIELRRGNWFGVAWFVGSLTFVSVVFGHSNQLLFSDIAKGTPAFPPEPDDT